MGFSWSRVVAGLLGFGIGIVYGVAATVTHAYTLGGFPLGLLISIVGVAALLVAVRLLADDRWAALATGLGVMTATLVFSGAGPGGSVIVPAAADGEFPAGLVWTLSVPLIVAVVIAWPRLPERTAPAGDRAAAADD